MVVLYANERRLLNRYRMKLGGRLKGKSLEIQFLGAFNFLRSWFDHRALAKKDLAGTLKNPAIKKVVHLKDCKFRLWRS